MTDQAITPVAKMEPAKVPGWLIGFILVGGIIELVVSIRNKSQKKKG
jgi:hypothetical protein